MDEPLKLNLGCGAKLLPGYLNVDKYGAPELVCDLEQFPWPWPDNSVQEVLLIHVLEHLGQHPDTFIGIMKELYRVCRDGAVIRVVVPHPRHDHYLWDPTHVRPITPQTLAMFSRQENLLWQEQGVSNTPFALMHGVDFEITAQEMLVAEPYFTQLREGRIGTDQLHHMEKSLFNVIQQYDVTLRVNKSA